MLFEDFRQYLEEKLLILGKGKKYGQAAILAGGAGSGKSFATKHFMQGENYKIYNVDDVKEMMVKLAKGGQMVGLSNKLQVLLPQLRNFDLHNPDDTGKLHMIIKKAGIDDLQMLYTFIGEPHRTYLPNVMFDCTLKSEAGAKEMAQMCLDVGYKPEDIHIVWILSDYKIALQQNYHRDRRVFNDILFDSHLGAKKTMTDLVIKNYEQLKINGDLAVIIGGPQQKYQILGKEVSAGSQIVKSGGQQFELPQYTPAFMGTAGSKEWAKDFTYFRLKKAGKPGMDEYAVKAILDFAEKLAPPQTGFDASIAQKFPQTSRH